jgi:hypothetical protein
MRLLSRELSMFIIQFPILKVGYFVSIIAHGLNRGLWLKIMRQMDLSIYFPTGIHIPLVPILLTHFEIHS